MNLLGPPPLKVVILGESSVGKTSLAHRFASDTFNEHTVNTIGAAFITKEYTSKRFQDKKIKFEIWDTAGQERYRSLTPMYYRGAKIALVCFDLSQASDSFQKVKEWIDELDLNTNREDLKQILIGTKSDLASEQVDMLKYKLGQDNSINFYSTSAKTGENVSQIFEDIVNDIPGSYFEQYYQKNREQEQKAQQSDMLGLLNLTSTSSSTNNCC